MVVTLNLVKKSLESEVSRKIRKYEEIAYTLAFYSIFSSGTSMFLEKSLLTEIMAGTILVSSSIAIYFAIKSFAGKRKLPQNPIPV